MSAIQMGKLEENDQKVWVLSQLHAEAFLHYFESFVEMFGLQNYQYMFYFPGSICENSRASIYCQLDGGQVQLSLSECWDIEPTHANLARTAFHEAMELALVPLEIIGKMRFASENRFEEEVHKIVRLLENKFFEMMVRHEKILFGKGEVKTLPRVGGKSSVRYLRKGAGGPASRSPSRRRRDGRKTVRS